MAEFPAHDRTLGSGPARNLANTTKTPPQWRGTTPRWLVSLLPWTPVEAGTYRINRVKQEKEAEIAIACSPGDNDDLPAAYIDYEDPPLEHTLSTVTTTIEVQTRISDLFRSPMDQVREQLSVLIDMMKERQENELVNNPSYGLLHNAAAVDARADPQGPAHAGRLRRAHHARLEGAGVLPGPPARHRGVRARVHPARCAARDRHAVRARRSSPGAASPSSRRTS